MVYVYVNGYIEETSVPDPEDSWDRPNTQFVYGGISVVNQNYVGYTSKAGPGERVYVVLVRYGSGDTFGNDDGQVDVMDVFDSVTEAEDLRLKLKAVSPWNIRGAKILPWEIKCNGKAYRVPWRGYFESYEDVFVEEAYVEH